MFCQIPFAETRRGVASLLQNFRETEVELPRMSSFFITFVTIKTFLGLGLELVRTMSLVQAALRYGFTYEGCFRQHAVTAKGYTRDTNWYSMLDSEWPQRKAALEAWLDSKNFDGNGKQRTSAAWAN